LKKNQFSSIKDISLYNAEKFAQITVKMLNNIIGSKYTVGNLEYLETGVELEKKFFVTVVFTGTIYGEYILAMNEEVAARCLDKDTNSVELPTLENIRQEISDTFCEILNIVAGESILALSENYESLTFAAPRVFWGNVRYPKIKSGKATLLGENGPIECYIFLDCMKLEIATNYQDTLSLLKSAHSELQSAHVQLKNQQAILIQSEKMAALGTMAAGIAHEINTPLTTATLISENLKNMLQETIIDTEAVAKDLSNIERTIVRISKITNSLKTFAYGAKGSKLLSVSVLTIIEDVLFFYDHHLKKNTIKIDFSQVPVDLMVTCRMQEISQVILNLLINSHDAIEKLSDKWINISAVDQGEYIDIKVTDSGFGIPKEVKDKIFDPFFTTKDIGRGTGLGLSISKGIVDNHGGQLFIDLESLHTCFIVRLPNAPSI
jgi:signal transduction histidine kinase